MIPTRLGNRKDFVAEMFDLILSEKGALERSLSAGQKLDLCHVDIVATPRFLFFPGRHVLRVRATTGV
jgi:hypothetical protein